MSPRQHWPGLTIAILCLIWGSTWIAIKFGLDDLPPFLFAGMRFAVASVVLLGLMRVQGASFPRDGATWKVMLVLGVFQAIDYACVFWAEQYIDSAIAAILFATMPFFVAVFSYFMPQEHRITWNQLVGISISFIGVVLIFLRNLSSSRNSLAGDAVILIGSMSGAFISVYAKKHANRIPAVTNATVQMIFTSVSLGLIGLIAEDASALHFTSQAVTAIVYLGVVGSAIAFALYMWVIKKVTVMEASVITLCTPIVAIALGGLMRGESLGLNAWIGTALILVGVYFVNILEARRATRMRVEDDGHKPGETALVIEEELHG